MVSDERVHDVIFRSADVELAGTLAVPDRRDPAPRVVMVGGSGPSDRTNDNFFPPIVRHLVESGIAVLSYDKRGVGASSGDWLSGTIDDFAADAVAALNFLRSQPRCPGRGHRPVRAQRGRLGRPARRGHRSPVDRRYHAPRRRDRAGRVRPSRRSRSAWSRLRRSDAIGPVFRDPRLR
ncbi:CocE/NonD family hydrolase [Amycolatopsis lexingtonensis]|uniref:alpha/beta hydrolase family protein n=1 Tax=Amycolatopsis lexingtonensis TaxID=218822 RepID=UPI0011784561